MRRLELLYLSRRDVEAVGLEMSQIVQVVEEALREKGEGRVEMPPKPGVHPKGDAFIHAMPAFIPQLGSVGMKWVSGFPENYRLGLPYISGLLILNDPNTGLPLAVMDCTWITAMRTGAATAVAAKYLARQDSQTLGILGCGVQGRSNLEALKVVFPGLRYVKAYDIYQANAEKYAQEMTEKLSVEVKVVISAEEAVRDADLVVTAGPILKHPSPVIEDEWFKPGGFACPVDFDSYWKPSALHGADKFCTDDTEQLFYYRKEGYFQDVPQVYADLGEIVAGKKPGRENDKERIISMNLGLALEDMAVGIEIYRRAESQGIGRMLPL